VSKCSLLLLLINQGNFLQAGIIPLKPQFIRAAMERDSLKWLSRLEIRAELDSTNRYLVARAKAGANRGEVCLAEVQLAGKGRCDRSWISPPTGNIYLSLLWLFPRDPQSLSGLSVAAGVAVLRALQDQEVASAGLKWPNDVLWGNRKLGGILVELVSKGDITGAVIGVGINVNMPISYREQLNQPCADLSEVIQDRPISRNQLVGRLIHHLLLVMHGFEEQGLSYCLNDWRRWDVCYQREVYLYMGNRVISGIACGIDDKGGLLLWGKDGISCYPCGEVSLRLAK
jgi:BirA family biotin operon repressor/biotin-[acetyl-CoA-carboxylase] ligase